MPCDELIRKLHFDRASGRWCLGDWELHCGDCFDVYVSNNWYPVRIEHSHGRGGWYLIGLPWQFGSCVDDYQARRSV